MRHTRLVPLLATAAALMSACSDSPSAPAIDVAGNGRDARRLYP